jgi:hypothetical protein
VTCTGDLAVIVPSRGTPEHLPGLIAALEATARAQTALIVAADLADPRADEYAQQAAAAPALPGLLILEQTQGSIEAVNNAAARYAAGVPHLAYMPDWYRPQTPAWDVLILERMRRGGHPLGYGVEPALPTWARPGHIVMSSQIVLTLGYLIPPAFTSMAAGPGVWSAWAGGAGAGPACVREAVFTGRHDPRAARRVPPGWSDYRADGYDRDMYRLAAL